MQCQSSVSTRVFEVWPSGVSGRSAFLDEGEMIGSLIILDGNVLEDAKAWSANDSFVKTGFFKVSNSYLKTR